MAPEPKESRAAIARWENEGGKYRPPLPSAGDELQIELRKYGIASVPLMVFDWGGYRYTNARDAIAAAKRPVRSV